MEPNRPGGCLLFIRSVIGANLVLLLLTALIWWLGGWRTLAEFSSVLIWVGVGGMALGALSHQGSLGFASDPWYHYVETTGLNDRRKRALRHSDDIQQAFSFMVIMLTAGFLTLLSGWLVNVLSG